VLSSVAWSAAETDTDAAAAFAAATANLPAALNLTLRPRRELSTQQLIAALEKVRTTPPALRRRLLESCTFAIAHDGMVYAREAELLRAIAEAIDLPMPPLAPASTLATTPP
jgi:hypothetical protein